MFLFYTLMCRNYQEYKWKPCWSQIWTFQKSVPELFSRMVTLWVEDSVKQKTLQLQSCREFHGKRSGYTIHIIPSPDGRVRPDLVRPKMGRQESERHIKGGTLAHGGHLHPRICSHQSHVFASPMDPISMGKGSHEAMKEGAKGRRSPMMLAAGEFPAPPLAPPPAPLAAHLCHLHRYLYHQLLLLCSGLSSHTPLYHPI
jgi:hypothetical protein